MGTIPASFPAEGRVFEGRPERRFLALSIETLVHDVSPVGDGEVAKQLGAYTFGDGPPPAAVPAYVELEDDHLTVSNPPFLAAEIDVVEDDGHTLELAFDSELNLLIDPPVRVSFEGSLGEVVQAVEQLVAEIYRTKGRRLEMLDAGVVGAEDFMDR